MPKQFAPPAAALIQVEGYVRSRLRPRKVSLHEHFEALSISELVKKAATLETDDPKLSAEATRAVALRQRRFEDMSSAGLLPEMKARKLDDLLRAGLTSHIAFAGHLKLIEFKRLVPTFASLNLSTLAEVAASEMQPDEKRVEARKGIEVRQGLLSEWCLTFADDEAMATAIKLQIGGDENRAFALLDKLLAGSEKTLNVEAKQVARMVDAGISR